VNSDCEDADGVARDDCGSSFALPSSATSGALGSVAQGLRGSGAASRSYLIVRGALETVCYVLLAFGWLLLVPLGDVMSAGLGTAPPAGVRLGDLVIDSDATTAVLTLVFGVGVVVFYSLLHRSRIVPRWITLWDLIPIPLYVAPDLYGAIGATLPAQDLMQMPPALQEMVLAVWMIARGFRPATGSTERASSERGIRRRARSAARPLARR
jgi:hypothetical protein